MKGREGAPSEQCAELFNKKKKKKKKKTGARYLQNAPASCPGRDAFMLVTPCVVFNNIVRLRSVIKSSGTGQMLDRSAV